MFPSKSFVKLVKVAVLTAVFASLVFTPKWTFASVRSENRVSSGAKASGKVKIISMNHFKQVDTEETEVPTNKQPESVNTATARRAEDWQTWDVIPAMTPNALSIYRQGLALGNNPRAFSKIGDGEISAAWFLTDFDFGPDYYALGIFGELETTIEYFSGSFGRQSQAARRGFNAQRVLDPSLASIEFCQSGETPLDCELRLYRPSFAIISMGTNQVWQPEQFESGLREIIETLIKKGVVPVLSTKADNLEGDGGINLIVARLSVEYDLPLWNFWRAVQPLPAHGLQGDNEHLTYHPNNFAILDAMQYAWPMRNLSALQVLEKLMEDTTQQPAE